MAIMVKVNAWVNSIVVDTGAGGSSKYKRPGGVDLYKRPGGADDYLRP